MGLMSWLRGGRGDGSRSGSGDVPTTAPAAADGEDRVDVDRLEPMQRGVSGQQLTLAPAQFEASLATRQDTALGRPLGHLVSPDAPSGLVHGVGEPASPSPPVVAQRSVEMPLRGAVVPSGRMAGAEGVRVRAPETSEPWSGPVAVAVPVQRLYGGEDAAMTSAAGAESGAGGVEELPVRRLVGERPVVAAPPAPGSPPAQPAASGSTGVQRAAAGPPAGERARRVPGLGAPLPGLPPTAQRQAASASALPSESASASASASGEGAGVVEPASAVPPVPAGPTAGQAGGAEESTAPLLGDDPLVGEVAQSSPGSGPDSGGISDVPHWDGPVPAGHARDGVGDAAGGSVQRSVGPATPSGPTPAGGEPVAPLLGDRPLVPQNVDVQRAAGTAPEPAAGSAPHPAALAPVSAAAAEGVPVRWAEAADLGTGSGPGVPLGPAPPMSAPARTPPAPLQRQAVGGPPVPASVARSRGPGSGGGRGVHGDAGAVAVAAGVAQRMADGSVVFGSPTWSPTLGSPPYGSPPLPGTSRPVVQRAAEVAEEPPPPEPDPVTETEADTGADPGPVPDGDSVSAAHRAADPAKGNGTAPPVTDELVRALYAPLSRLLKNDLRLERERAGFLINTRH